MKPNSSCDMDPLSAARRGGASSGFVGGPVAVVAAIDTGTETDTWTRTWTKSQDNGAATLGLAGPPATESQLKGLVCLCLPRQSLADLAAHSRGSWAVPADWSGPARSGSHETRSEPEHNWSPSFLAKLGATRARARHYLNR